MKRLLPLASWLRARRRHQSFFRSTRGPVTVFVRIPHSSSPPSCCQRIAHADAGDSGVVGTLERWNGGSHLCEQTSVKIPFPEISITCLTCVWSEAAVALVRRTRILTAFYPLAYHQLYPACALRRNHSPPEHAPSESFRLLQQPSVTTGMFTSTMFSTSLPGQTFMSFLPTVGTYVDLSCARSGMTRSFR